LDRYSGQQVDGRNHHPTLTIAALWHLLIDPRLLDRMQLLRRISALKPFSVAQRAGNPSIVVTSLPTA